MIDLLNKIHHADCLDFMRGLPDKCIDLVLTDPPYGIDFGTFNRTNKDSKGNRYKADKYKNGDWDKEFNLDEYFKQIDRISHNWIIWGGNYFDCLWPNKGFIFWHKKNPVPNFSDGELACTSFNKPAQYFEYAYYGNIEGRSSANEKYHPTQKPLQLFKWCIGYAKLESGIVLDCFSGSGTTALACHDLGLDFICIEKDADYHAASVKRLEEHKRQGKLF